MAERPPPSHGPPRPLVPVAPDGSAVAGVGRRAAGALVDAVWALGLGAAVGSLVPSGDGAAGILVGLAGVTAYLSLLVGAFTAMEALSGRTPGKLASGTRVIRSDGSGPDLRAAWLRNAIRLLDFLPAAYVVGGATALADQEGRRLGDRAAGTWVVIVRR